MIQAALTGQGDLVVGNVVGSNICNVLLILGLSAVITPLAVSWRLIRFDVPIMIAASLLLLALASEGKLGRIDSLVLFVGLVGYLVWTSLGARRESAAHGDETARAMSETLNTPVRAILAGLFSVALGLVLLTLGSHLLVSGSVALARLAQVSELVIGLTIVAIGTSLPELATSVLAAFRGERDIAVGNIVGSNLFNILGILGISGLVAAKPIHVSAAALRFDIPVMTIVALACLPVFFTGRKIARWEGALFLAYYAAYLTLLILHAMGSSSVRTFGLVMILFVVPLTAITLLASVIRNGRGQVPG